MTLEVHAALHDRDVLAIGCPLDRDNIWRCFAGRQQELPLLEGFIRDVLHESPVPIAEEEQVIHDVMLQRRSEDNERLWVVGIASQIESRVQVRAERPGPLREVRMLAVEDLAREKPAPSLGKVIEKNAGAVLKLRIVCGHAITLHRPADAPGRRTPSSSCGSASTARDPAKLR